MRSYARVIAVVMIVGAFLFSSLVVFVPANVSAATIYTWNAPADGVASLNTNWDPVGVPTNTDSVIFSTSVKNCTWDLEVSLDNFTIETTFTGWVNQTAEFAVDEYYQAGGTFNCGWTPSYDLNVNGDFVLVGGQLNSGRVKVVMAGDGGLLYTATIQNFRRITIADDVQIASAASINTREMVIEAGCTVDIYNLSLTNTMYDTGWVFTNNGTITTTNTGRIAFLTASLYIRTLSMGKITCQSGIFAIPTTSADAIVNNGGDAVLSTFAIGSQHVTYSLSFNQSGYDLSTDTITVSDLGILNANGSMYGDVTVSAESEFTNVGDTVVTGDLNFINGTLTGTEYALTVTGIVTNIFSTITQGTGIWRFGDYSQTGESSTFYQNGTVEILGDFQIGQPGLDFSERETVITSDRWIGPGDALVKATNGDYLHFVRNATSHAGAGDYSWMDMYRSEDRGETWSLETTLVNYSDRDVRNYAAGVSSTGRVIVVFGVMDCDNYTGPYRVPTYCQYIYSDDNGASWSAPVNMPASTTDGYADDSITSYGDVVVSGSRIGVARYGGNMSQNSSMVKWFYSDDDGGSWDYVDMSEVTYYGVTDGRITETHVIDIGDGRLVGLARINNYGLPRMFTSDNAGTTWSDRGYVDTMNWVSPHHMVLFESQSIYYILSITYYSISLYSVASAEDVFRIGPDAFPLAVNITGGWPSDVGKYGTTIYEADTSTIYVLTSYEGDCLIKSQVITITNTTQQIWSTTDGTISMLSEGAHFTTNSANDPGNINILANDIVLTIPDGIITGSITVSATRWTMAFTNNPTATHTYNMIGLSGESGYKVYQDGVLKMEQPAGSSILSFIAGEGEFEVIAWDLTDDTTLPEPGATEESPKTSDPAETSLSYTSIGFIAVVCASTVIILLLLVRRTRGPSRSSRS